MVASLKRDTAAISSVNAAEVCGKLIDYGWPADDVGMLFGDLQVDVLEFGLEEAVVAGSLRSETRGIGLSLGDRACLATAKTTGMAMVLTADRVWDELHIEFEFDARIVLIR